MENSFLYTKITCFSCSNSCIYYKENKRKNQEFSLFLYSKIHQNNEKCSINKNTCKMSFLVYNIGEEKQMIKLNQLWNNVLIEVQSKVSTLAYDVYISNLEPVGVYNDTFILLAQTPALKRLVNENYKELLKLATSTIFPTITDVKVLLEKELADIEKIEKEVDVPVSKENFLDSIEQTTFVENYTFDNFIVGKSNQHAAAVCKAVAEAPGGKYNPLFIHSGVGLGKTHLLHAIGNYVKKHHPEKKTIYTTSEKFTNELIEAVRAGAKDPDATKKFRNKYRSVDLLMIDDIQFLANTEVTLEEFFHTFNDLYMANKQLVICSDRPPKEINIEERLRTRFAMGVISSINPPDFETRIAILQKKAINFHAQVSMDVLRIIADRCKTNVREMEGLLNRIISQAMLVGGDYNDMSVVWQALEDYGDNQKEILSIDKIVEATCEYFRITKEMMVSKKKNKEIAFPRQIAMYLARELLPIPLESIGDYFGGRHHTTIMYARDIISEQIKTNSNTAAQVKDIKDKILKR